MDLYPIIDASQEPILKIHDWIQEAKEKGAGLPHALNLASVSQDGQPSSRMVLLKRLSDEGLVFFTDYEGKKGNYSENDPVKPFNNYGLSKLGGECAVAMYKNSLILRITMTEKPFVHKKAYSNLKSNFMFHEDLVKILPKIIKQKGILNVGGKSQSVFSFAKKYNSKVKKIKAKKSSNLPLNQTMNLAKSKKIVR